MTWRGTVGRISQIVADDYVMSWFVGMYFIAPFALTGFAAQSFFHASFNFSLLIALAVATPIAVSRALRLTRPGALTARVDKALKPVLPRT